MDRINIDLTLREHSRDVDQKSGTVVTKNLDLRAIQTIAAVLTVMLPFRIRRSFSISDKLMILTQSVLWMDTPRPLVTKPTISSPGTGLQHLEK